MSSTTTDKLSDDVIAMMQETFGRQGALRAWDARLAASVPGTCEVSVPMSEVVTQHHGFFHGGVVATVADVAGGYAANTVLMPTHECLSAEFKINFVAPAIGDTLIGRGKVAKAGKTLVVVTVELFARNNGVEKMCALAQQTLFVIPMQK